MSEEYNQGFAHGHTKGFRAGSSINHEKMRELLECLKGLLFAHPDILEEQIKKTREIVLKHKDLT